MTEPADPVGQRERLDPLRIRTSMSKGIQPRLDTPSDIHRSAPEAEGT